LYWLGAVLLVLLTLGLVADLLSGARVIQNARSPLAALLGVAAIGALCLAGEELVAMWLIGVLAR
jgi:hypothetical protein